MLQLIARSSVAVKRLQHSVAKAYVLLTRKRTLTAAVKHNPAERQANDAIVHYVVEKYVDGPSSLSVKIEKRDQPCITFATQDFLGFGGELSVRKIAEQTLEKYTVGSCGPRGFYGTTLAHLDLEESLARFMGTPESITYSDATATIASAIPAFAKRGDVLLIDSGANYGIQLGAQLSRSKIVYWNHNDTIDLERKLEAVAESDLRKRDASLEQRRFIVVEGLYANSGSLCPLREVQRLAAKYRWRIIVDDSLGFGVLGPNGRGITEHAGLSTTDVDVLVGSLATSLGSVGGFCVGSREVVDHQRLSGAGYCFSASAPPFLCAVAAASLQELQQNKGRLDSLRAKCKQLHDTMASSLPAFEIVSHAESPVKHLVLRHGPITQAQQMVGQAASGPSAASRMLSPTTQKLTPPEKRMAEARIQEGRLLDRLVVSAASKGILLGKSHAVEGEPFPSWPSVKLYLTVRHTKEHMDQLVNALRDVAEEMELTH